MTIWFQALIGALLVAFGVLIGYVWAQTADMRRLKKSFENAEFRQRLLEDLAAQQNVKIMRVET